MDPPSKDYRKLRRLQEEEQPLRVNIPDTRIFSKAGEYRKERRKQEKEAHAPMHPSYNYEPRTSAEKKNKSRSRNRLEASASAANHSMLATNPHLPVLICSA